MKKYTLNPDYLMTQEHINTLKNLPPNMPDVKLTRAQIDTVNNIYYHYLGKTFKGWGTELYKVEQGEKWPSGPRIKAHEAKRICLGHLLHIQGYKSMTSEDAAKAFLVALSCRESYQIVLNKSFIHNL